MTRKQRKRRIWEKLRPVPRRKGISEPARSSQAATAKSEDIFGNDQLIHYPQNVSPVVHHHPVSADQSVPLKGRNTRIYDDEEELKEEEKGENSERWLQKALQKEERAKEEAEYCRRAESEEIINFIEAGEWEVLHIFGSPGTGKTYLVRQILRNLGLEHATKWVNCYQLFNGTIKKPNLTQPFSLLVLDQFDVLRKTQQLSHYLSHQHTTKMILISNVKVPCNRRSVKQIANSSNIKQLQFLPYSIQELVRITKNKLVYCLNQAKQQEEFELAERISRLDLVYSVQASCQISHDLRFVLANAVQSITKSELSKKAPKEYNVLGLYLANISLPERQIFNSLLKKSEGMREGDIHKLGRLLQVSSRDISLWVSDWLDMDIIEQSPIHQRQLTLENNIRLKIDKNEIEGLNIFS